MPLDLSTFSDRDVLLALGETQPDFVDLIAGLIDAGRTDEEIVRLAARADGSAQAMHYTAKVCRALRTLAREKALDELTAESQRLNMYGVEVAPGAVASVSPTASPQTLDALGHMVRLAKKS